ncbi:MAG: type II toxin-antitoxin system RelE/ParE family toxin [Deltaproteobacteria bacterium]|nr:type II toxin-antitoxin system RelE/ParE family toxin [Deltaproteobacteria bacterium]
MRVKFYTTLAGRSPVLDYLSDLPKFEYSRFLRVLNQIENYGFEGIGMQFRHIEGKMWEIKMSLHRIFYMMLHQDEMILLHAYKKQGQKMPLRERETAMNRMMEICHEE